MIHVITWPEHHPNSKESDHTHHHMASIRKDAQEIDFQESESGDFLIKGS